MKKSVVSGIATVAMFALAWTILHYVNKFGGLRWVWPTAMIMIACLLVKWSPKTGKVLGLLAVLVFATNIVLSGIHWASSHVADAQKNEGSSTSSSQTQNTSPTPASEKKEKHDGQNNAGGKTTNAKGNSPSKGASLKDGDGEISSPKCPVLLNERTPENCPEAFKQDDGHQTEGNDSSSLTSTQDQALVPTPQQKRKATLVYPISGGNGDVEVTMEDTCKKSKPGWVRCTGYVTNNIKPSLMVTLYDSHANYDHGNPYDLYTFGRQISFKDGDSASATLGTAVKFSVNVPAEEGKALSLTINFEWAGSGGLATFVFAKDSALSVE